MPLTLATRTHGRTATDPHTPTPAVYDRGRTWLTRLHAGDVAFPAVVPAPLPHAAGRAPAEHDALARALGCRDLFLIDAADRHARERLIAELIRAAAGRGERVLALSPDPVAADRIAEAVAADHCTRVVRALAADENPYRPVPGATRLTSAALGPGRVDHQRRDLASAVAAAEHALAPLAAASAAAAELHALAERFFAATRDRAELTARRENLEADAAQSPPLAALRTEQEAVTARLTKQRVELTARREVLEADLAGTKQHLVEAQADAGKRPGLFARLFGKHKHHGDPADLERHIQDAERELKDLSDREAKLAAELDAAAAQFSAARDKLLAEEVAARRAELDARIESLTADRDDAAGRFALRGKDLESLGFAAPRQLTVEAADRVAAEIAERRREPDRRLADARNRLAELDRAADDAVRRSLDETRAVVGTPGSLDADPVFETAAGGTHPPFGLLILDHAEELTDPDFVRLSRLAERWVLAGDASHPDPAPPPNGSHRPSRNGRPIEPTFAARLARLLDREPWVAEADRLVFRLLHLTADQRRAATREPVADHPHVELRVTLGENGQGVLAEIAFPASTPIAEAKQFLTRQLGEVLLRPCGELHWHQSADHLSACWPAADHDPAPAAWVELEAGVREKVVGAGPAAFTAAVAFEVAAGWDAESAQAWLDARLPAAGPGRLAVFPRGLQHDPHPHRPVAVG